MRPAAKFNLRHNARDLYTNATACDPLWIRDKNRQGQIVSRTPEPPSYLVITDLGTVRRNRRALVPTSRGSDDSNGRWTPPTRVSTTHICLCDDTDCRDATTNHSSEECFAASCKRYTGPPLPKPGARDRLTRSVWKNSETTEASELVCGWVRSTGSRGFSAAPRDSCAAISIAITR